MKVVPFSEARNRSHFSLVAPLEAGVLCFGLFEDGVRVLPRRKEILIGEFGDALEHLVFPPHHYGRFCRRLRTLRLGRSAIFMRV